MKGEDDTNASCTAKEDGEEEHDDIPHYPLHFGSPAFVCVPDDEAYRVETEGMRRLVERRRLLAERKEKEKLKRAKKSKHANRGKHEHDTAKVSKVSATVLR